jgi:hypothetical protein
MIGRWMPAGVDGVRRQYRFVHPLTLRTQDVWFTGDASDRWEKVIKAREPHMLVELAGPKPSSPQVSRMYSISKTAFANDVYNDLILTGKVEPAPSLKHFFDKPERKRTLW